MGRPAGYQWRPLGLDIDPVPGDPAQISQEAQHLASVAAEITNQVAALRKISSDGTEIGQHADTIRSSASGLAGQLDKVVGRYQKVSSALNSWIPDLEQAQTMSIQALNQAEGPYQKLNQTVALPAGPNLTAQQKQDVQNYHTAMTQAQDDLAAAQALLTRATTLRDTAASRTASLINNACNDGMRDHYSLWGSITGWFGGAFHWVEGHWSQILADVCTVLEVVATVLAIAAFIIAQFIPGIDVLVDTLVLASMIATGAALGGRIALAATHHGSWVDVGVDAAALLTFGLGRVAGAIARQILPELEAGSKTAFLTDMLADDTKEGAMLSKFADMMGSNKAALALKFAESAPKVANDAELSGFYKVMMNIGGFSKFGDEEGPYAKIIKLGTQFASDNNNLGDYATVAKSLVGFTGISTSVAGLTGLTATVVNGWSTNYLGTLDIPALHNWYTNNLEIPTGAPQVADLTDTALAASGYALVLPTGWRRIPVRHGTTPAIRGVVDEVLRRNSTGVSRDKLTPYRIDLERRLSGMAKQARSAGGIDLYLPIEYTHGVTITASFVVSQITLPEPPAEIAEAEQADQADAAQLVAYLTSDAGDASAAEIAGADAARKESVAAADPAQQMPYGSRRVDYMIPVPGYSRGMLVVTFSTIGDGDPAGEFAKLLVVLFDAIMTTFRWTTNQVTHE